MNCKMDDRVFVETGMFKGGLGCACANEHALAVAMSRNLRSENLFLGGWQIDQGCADVSAHCCDFRELGVLLVWNAADTEKRLGCGLTLCRICQVQRAR